MSGFSYKIAFNSSGIATFSQNGTIGSAAYYDKIPESAGGTNQDTYTQGDLLYASALNTLSRLAGNSTTTRKFFLQNGDGSIPNAPQWTTISNSDVSNLTPTSDAQFQSVTIGTAGLYTLQLKYTHTTPPPGNRTLTFETNNGDRTLTLGVDFSVTAITGTGALAYGTNPTINSPTLTGTVGGDAILAGTLNWNGSSILPTFGGTGLNAYSLGDTLYCSASNVLSKLTGNTTTTKKFLTQTGNGTNSAAPSWLVPASTDLSDVASLATLTGAQTLTNKTFSTSCTWNGNYFGIGTIVNTHPVQTTNYFFLKDPGNSFITNAIGINVIQDSTATAQYTQIGTIQNNNGEMVIQGSLSAHTASLGKCNINLLISKRDTFLIQGSADGLIGNSDIKIYADGSGNLTVYLVTSSFSECNLNVLCSSNGAALVSILNPTSTTPAGTLVYTLSTGTGVSVTDNVTRTSNTGVVSFPASIALTAQGTTYARKSGGSNATSGTINLNGTTPVTIFTTALTANSQIEYYTQSGGATGVIGIGTKTVGVSFTLVSSMLGDTRSVGWKINEVT